MTTEEEFLIDFSDYKLVAPPRRVLTVVLKDSILKDIISYLEIDDTINLRRVNKKLKLMSEDYIKELTELSIYFYETTKFKNI